MGCQKVGDLRFEFSTLKLMSFEVPLNAACESLIGLQHIWIDAVIVEFSSAENS